MNEKHTMPADIERTSMQVITKELAEMGVVLPEENAAVIKRVIHTTADFDYAKNLCFTEKAVAKAICAMRQNAIIITDTNMARSGISKPAMEQLGVQADCYMADAEIAEAAKAGGTTRAVAAVQKGTQRYPGAVYAAGNAPTALFELCRQMERGVRPALVIGVPVGFVNVEDSKRQVFAACEKYGVPAIVAMGRKGGSTVAAAICNALLYAAADMQDPSKRGWQG